jgi:hypothetical protein
VSSEYTTILKTHGFSSLTEDLHNTITAYTYEINGVLFDEDSPFDANESETRSQPEDLNTLVYCTLRLKTDSNIHDAINYLISKWYKLLRQSNPIFENIETTLLENGTQIRILTISEHTACTIEFKIFQNN